MAGVECRDVRARALGGEAPLDDADVRAHVEGCPACAVLVEDGARLARTLADADEDAAPPELAALERATVAAIEDAAGPLERVRQLATPARAAILASGAGLGVLLVGVASARPDMAVHPMSSLLLALASLGLAALAAGAVILRPLHRPRPAPWVRHLALTGAIAVPLALALLPAAHHAHPASIAGVGDDLWPRALACFAYGAGWSTCIAALAWLTDRSRLRGRGIALLALLGAAAFGNLVLVLHCPLTAPTHKLAGHATVSVLFLVVALVGTLVVGARAVRRR